MFVHDPAGPCCQGQCRSAGCDIVFNERIHVTQRFHSKGCQHFSRRDTQGAVRVEIQPGIRGNKSELLGPRTRVSSVPVEIFPGIDHPVRKLDRVEDRAEPETIEAIGQLHVDAEFGDCHAVQRFTGPMGSIRSVPEPHLTHVSGFTLYHGLPVLGDPSPMKSGTPDEAGVIGHHETVHWHSGTNALGFEIVIPPCNRNSIFRKDK